MHIGFDGQVRDERQVRAGFIGCGSHAFRNIYPALQFAPVELVATCDLNIRQAEAFAHQFGAERAYAAHHEMLAQEGLDAVFIVVGYDARGRPLYPRLTIDCVQAGCHVWIEKPPAASCAEIENMMRAAAEAGRHVMVGFKKMLCPANEKAKALMQEESFGHPSLALLQYPLHIPLATHIAEYVAGDEERGGVRGFLDHLCHPVSLLLFLFGMPRTLSYERAASGAGNATFTFASGAIASLALTSGASSNTGMERTTIIGDKGQHIVVENNIRVTLHRSPPNPPGQGYGSRPDYFTGAPEQASAVWEPEFSLGQVYNKGLFLLGYYNEVNEFAQAILEGRAPANGTLEQAWQATHIFEAFAQGPGKTIPLAAGKKATPSIKEGK